MKTFLTPIIIFCGVLLAISCGEDRTHEYEEKTQHNHWMYDVMQDRYLWAEALSSYEPTWKNFFATPENFLATLTAKSGHSDSWSYVEIDTVATDSHERGYFNHINSYGFDFVLMTDPTGQTTRSVLRVLTVYPDSPAERAGLVRNDFICSFDNYKISTSNVSRLQKGTARSLEVRHLMQEELEGNIVWKDTVTVSLGASEYVEDVAFPVSNLINVNGVNVGYMMCTRLLECPSEKGSLRANTTVYRDDLDAIMLSMKHAGVDEMVLDLRLCNDGTLEMAQRLASYVVAPQHLGDTFVQTIWNERHTANNQTLSYDASVKNLGLSRVYILTSSSTQGAAEWLIHALQYTMGEDNVITIGEATAGQDVLTQEVGHEYYVHLFPVVAYVADGGGTYGYSSITPTYSVNEQSYLNLGDYGTLDEILFYTAVANILGIGQDDSESGEESDNSSEGDAVE